MSDFAWNWFCAGQQALLFYQDRVHRDWHKTLGMLDTFSLILLQVGSLNDYHQELLNNAYATKIKVVRMVCTFYTSVATPTN